MTRVLIIEDEPALRADLVDYLSMRGFEVDGIGRVAEFDAAMAAGPTPAVVVLDIGLPDGDGFELAQRIRRNFDTGIIILTARGDSDDRIQGFESGADIYLVKHSTLREIEAAIQSLVRRLTGHHSGRSELTATADWVLDSRSWDLIAPNHQTIRLTAAELTFLHLLMSQPSKTCERDTLASALARPRAHFDNRHLDALVNRLRRKIERIAGEESPIKVVYGMGYVFSRSARIDN